MFVLIADVDVSKIGFLMGEKAFFMVLESDANRKGLGYIILKDVDLLKQFRSILDDSFCIFFKICCRQQIHRVYDSSIKTKNFLFVYPDSLVIEAIQSMHLFNDTIAQKL